MLNPKNWIFLAAALIFAISGSAQVTGPGQVWQLSGMVLSGKTKDPIPYATVRIGTTKRGIICDSKGFYSLPVVEGDTVFFRALGFMTSVLIVEEYLENYQGSKDSPYLYSINFLDEDSISLPTVYIFPYNTPGKLRTAILNMGSQQTLEEIHARQNMDPRELDKYIRTLDIDSGERIAVARQVYYQEFRNKDMAPVMPLFDPVAIYQLLKAITDRSKSKREKDLNYWAD